MTRASIWIARRPEDELADRLEARLNISTMTAAERRTAMNALRRRVVTMAQLRRRVDASRRPKSTAGAVRNGNTVAQQFVGGAVSSSITKPDGTGGPRKQGIHDPFGTCGTCAEYRRAYPAAALTAGGVPEGCPPHNWNEKPKPGQRWSNG